MELQRNYVSGLAYQGTNQPELMSIKARRGYVSDTWITYVQAMEKGLVLHNAKGQGVRLRTFIKDEKTGNTYPKWFVVFNSDLLKESLVTIPAN